MDKTLALFFISLLIQHTYSNITCQKVIGEQQLNLENEFQSYELVGKGGFGLVKGNKDFVIKQILVKSGEEGLINKEIRSMDSFKDQFDIVQFYDDDSCHYSIASYQHFKLYYKTLRYETDLLDYLITNSSKISIFKSLDLMIKMTLALYKFHIQGLIHADLKPENFFMMNQYTMVLADFGLSLSLFERRNFRSGTPNFMAPELQKRNVRTQDYTAAVDMYALGIIFLVFTTNQNVKYPHRMIDNIQKNYCQKQTQTDQSTKMFQCTMMNIIQRMIDKNVKTRSIAEGVARSLLKLLKYFKQRESATFSKMLNEEYKYYRNINEQSREAERVYKDQLLEKFELRKKIFFEEDFELRPTVLNEYVKLTTKLPNEYKNLDNGKVFIPSILYSDRQIAQQELDQARRIEQERIRRIEEQNQVNIVYQGLAYAGGALLNFVKNLGTQDQDDQENQMQQPNEDMSMAELEIANEDITNMLHGQNKPHLLQKLQPISAKQKTKNNSENEFDIQSSDEGEIFQESTIGQENKLINTSNVNQAGMLKKQFKEDFQSTNHNIMQQQRKNQHSNNMTLKQILELKPPQNFYRLRDQGIAYSPRDQRIQEFQREQNQQMKGYQSDDQKHDLFSRPKPQQMFLQPKKKNRFQIQTGQNDKIMMKQNINMII